ncbi:MAG: N-methyl-L-tryptophan oxidase [Luteitalea sp.]|nr:N-methyl-L-tryptophan oxidase [Luteitalea sp.]
MQRPYDVIVIGLGAMGSAALFHLARRGCTVLGLERFNIPHDRGSSHGITRIIRLAYYEHPSYVPLLRRAYELWDELERSAGIPLRYTTGSIDAGPAASAVVEGSLQSCQEHDLPHEVLTSTELTERFPGYWLPNEFVAVLQPQGGFLLPELCISYHVIGAQGAGAEVHAREQVLEWEPSPRGVVVTTERGVYEAEKLIVSAGAWMGKLVPPLSGLAVPERQVLAWMQPLRPDLFRPERFPVFNLVVEEGRYYGFPVFGIPGFKVGRYHHRDEVVDPDTMDWACHPEDERLLRAFTDRYFPAAAGPTTAMHACMFTNTPDKHFVLDMLPSLPQVIVASPCSGHGFKFASVVGEILADLATDGTTRHDISLHRLGRFVGGG